MLNISTYLPTIRNLALPFIYCYPMYYISCYLGYMIEKRMQPAGIEKGSEIERQQEIEST